MLGVTTVDEEVYFKGGGKRVFGDLSSGNVDPDSIFWVCSQTKMITRVDLLPLEQFGTSLIVSPLQIAALQLIEGGKLSQSTLVSEFFPEFANPIVVDDILSNQLTFKPSKVPVTVKHLLDFSSGLYYLRDEEGSRFSSAHVAVHDMQDPHSSFLKIVKVNNFPVASTETRSL